MAERRVALVIGNDRYTSIDELRKATNDAKAVGQALRDMMFDEVFEAIDADRRTMDGKIREFARNIREGDTAFFFYAGHGVAVGSKNYLLPVDFPKIQDTDDEGLVRDEARSVDSVLAAIQDRAPGRVFMILDACRDNPLPTAPGRNLGRSTGLATEAPVTGVFMLFSAGFGQSALDALAKDDPNPNSVFTRSLLPLLHKKGLSQVDIAKALQTEVNALAKKVNETQNPAYYDQIAGLYYLNGKNLEPNPADTQDSGVVVKPSPNEGGTSVLAEWNSVKDSTSKAVIEGFLAKYGKDPLFSALAKEKLEKLSQTDVASIPDAAASLDDASEPTLTVLPSADAVQAELKRLGCYAGALDGRWGRSSKASLAAFNKYAKTSFGDEPLGNDLMEALKEKRDAVCPSSCEIGKKLVNGDCQKISCRSGEEMNKSGECVKKVVVQKRKSTSIKTNNVAEPSNCFEFDGVKMCE
nr:caspase family protein [Ensifer aridi]